MASNRMTFVTSFINLNRLENNDNRRKVEVYLENGKRLLSLPFNFIVFLEPDVLDQVAPCFSDHPNITFLSTQFNELPIAGLLDPKTVSMPSQRNPDKDTFGYMAVMISKTFFIERAIQLNPYHSTQMAWVDFGVMYLFGSDLLAQEFQAALQRIADFNPFSNKVILPGCYVMPEATIAQLYRVTPIWMFCGGFFYGTLPALKRFAVLMQGLLLEMKDQNYITWEMSLWSVLAIRHPDLFDWYSGDHNLSMFSNFPATFGPR